MFIKQTMYKMLNPMAGPALVAQMVKDLPVMQETWVRSLPRHWEIAVNSPRAREREGFGGSPVPG